eukprot:scaffold56536_cov59-Attheya_sp.AAC.1
MRSLIVVLVGILVSLCGDVKASGGGSDSCVESLAEIQLEMTENILQVDKTASSLLVFHLCPNTLFSVETSRLSLFRPNVHILCGPDGSSAHNCTIHGTGYQITTEPFRTANGDAEFYFLDNVNISGVTFSGGEILKNQEEGVVYANVALQQAGDILFNDCVFKDNRADYIAAIFRKFDYHFFGTAPNLVPSPTPAPVVYPTEAPGISQPNVSPTETDSPTFTPQPTNDGVYYTSNRRLSPVDDSDSEKGIRRMYEKGAFLNGDMRATFESCFFSDNTLTSAVLLNYGDEGVLPYYGYSDEILKTQDNDLLSELLEATAFSSAVVQNYFSAETFIFDSCVINSPSVFGVVFREGGVVEVDNSFYSNSGGTERGCEQYLSAENYYYEDPDNFDFSCFQPFDATTCDLVPESKSPTTTPPQPSGPHDGGPTVSAGHPKSISGVILSAFVVMCVLSLC